MQVVDNFGTSLTVAAACRHKRARQFQQAASLNSDTVRSHTILGFGARFGLFSYFWCKI